MNEEGHHILSSCVRITVNKGEEILCQALIFNCFYYLYYRLLHENIMVSTDTQSSPRATDVAD